MKIKTLNNIIYEQSKRTFMVIRLTFGNYHDVILSFQLYCVLLTNDLSNERHTLWKIVIVIEEIQDGRTPHYTFVYRQYLNDTVSFRWIDRRGSMEWPARSADLSPLKLCCCASLRLFEMLSGFLVDLCHQIIDEYWKTTLKRFRISVIISLFKTCVNVWKQQTDICLSPMTYTDSFPAVGGSKYRVS